MTIQNGAVIGSDGFGYATQPDGSHLKIPQQADVVIEDDVEIGANTTIDRPAVGETRIRAGTKIDNLVQIGHGVTIGQRVLLASQVGIAGSAVVEDDVVMGGQVGVRRPPARRARRGRRRQDRHHEVGRAGRISDRLSGNSQPRVAKGVGDIPAPSRTEKAARRARAAGGRDRAARVAAAARRRGGGRRAVVGRR